MATTVDIQAASMEHGHTEKDILRLRLNEYAILTLTAQRCLTTDSVMMVNKQPTSGNVSLTESDRLA